MTTLDQPLDDKEFKARCWTKLKKRAIDDYFADPAFARKLLTEISHTMFAVEFEREQPKKEALP